MTTAILRGFGACALLALCVSVTLAEEQPGTSPPKETKRKVITLCGERMELMTGDEVKAMGFPWIDVPDEQNAATYYNQGANILYELRQKRSRETEKLTDQQRDHTFDFGWDDSMTELAACLDAAQPALACYRKGSSMKLCQPPYEKTASIWHMHMPDLSGARDACRLLAANARRLEARDRFKDAADDYLTIIRIGAHYGTGRSVIDHLVGIACIAIADSNAFKGITSKNYPREELERFLVELKTFRDHAPDPAHALRTDKAFGLQSVEDVMNLGPQGLSQLGRMGDRENEATRLSPLQIRLFRLTIPYRTVKNDLARAYDRLVQAAAQPWYRSEVRSGAKERELLATLKPWNVIGPMLLPALNRVATEANRCKATVELLRISLALKLYQQEHKVYPDTLDKLVTAGILKDLPTDPFSGKPFLYKLDKGEFTLYSVGENMKDDGGNLKGQVDFESGDWGFWSKVPPIKKYERPAAPPETPAPGQPKDGEK